MANTLYSGFRYQFCSTTNYVWFSFQSRLRALNGEALFYLCWTLEKTRRRTLPVSQAGCWEE